MDTMKKRENSVVYDIIVRTGDKPHSGTVSDRPDGLRTCDCQTLLNAQVYLVPNSLFHVINEVDFFAVRVPTSHVWINANQRFIVLSRQRFSIFPGSIAHVECIDCTCA